MTTSAADTAFEFVRWLRRQPERMDATTCAGIAAAASVATTWSPGAVAASADLAGFEALQREVRGAKRVRLTWAWLGMAAILAATLTPLLSHIWG